MVRVGGEDHGDPGAGAVQEAGDHEAVAAVVARAGEDRDPLAAHRKARANRTIDRLPRPLHQRQRRDGQLVDRPPIEARHLGSGDGDHQKLLKTFAKDGPGIASSRRWVWPKAVVWTV